MSVEDAVCVQLEALISNNEPWYVSVFGQNPMVKHGCLVRNHSTDGLHHCTIVPLYRPNHGLQTMYEFGEDIGGLDPSFYFGFRKDLYHFDHFMVQHWVCRAHGLRALALPTMLLIVTFLSHARISL